MIDLPQTPPLCNTENAPILHDGEEIAAWNVLVALQRHGLDNPALLENLAYRDAIGGEG